MTDESEAAHLERVEPEECMELLRSRTLGRVGIKHGDDIVVLPVFYAIVDGDVVFRTAPGTKLDAAVMKTRVAFEVDNGSPPWSVLVHGFSEEVRDEHGQNAARAHLGSDWPAGQRDRIVRIRVKDVTGRRIAHGH
jgi:nitroimidazol reductase NimA-like FMN-containing flavoprotein (pyridoxamine 5'-phosphate oxidase superfamily)